MQRKETLFEYLYHSLREEIISGRMPFGSTLPSIMRLCELYHVGIRTVRDVLERLKQEGYIKTEERKPMLVIYRQDQREQETAAVTYIVKYQQSLRDAYATMTLIMPRILSFSVQVCSDYTLHCMKESVEEAAEKNTELRWKTNLKIFNALLDQTHNMFFRDLFSSLTQDRYSSFRKSRAQALTEKATGFRIFYGFRKPCTTDSLQRAWSDLHRCILLYKKQPSCRCSA